MGVAVAVTVAAAIGAGVAESPGACSSVAGATAAGAAHVTTVNAKNAAKPERTALRVGGGPGSLPGPRDVAAFSS